jgi:hypothetical protein
MSNLRLLLEGAVFLLIGDVNFPLVREWLGFEESLW